MKEKKESNFIIVTISGILFVLLLGMFMSYYYGEEVFIISQFFTEKNPTYIKNVAVYKKGGEK